MISTLLILGCPVVTGAAIIATQERPPAQARSKAPTNSASHERELVKPAVPEKKVEMLSVRVVDTQGRGLENVDVKVVEVDATSADDGQRFRTGVCRTVADGWVRVGVDPRSNLLTFEARPDDRTLAWATLHPRRLLP